MSDRLSRADTTESYSVHHKRPAELQVLILGCCELQEFAVRRIFEPYGLSCVIRTRGGFTGLDATLDDANHWLIRQLEESPNIRTVVLCAHYDCTFVSAKAATLLNADENARFLSLGHNQLETIVVSERAFLKDLLAQRPRLKNVEVLGCVHDAEYDWLSIYDEDTGLFLPPNVHRLGAR